MINKTNFIRQFEINNPKLLIQVRDLIYDWHQIHNPKTPANYISDDLKDGLHKAIQYLIFLIPAEAEGFRDRTNNRAFNRLLYQVIQSNEEINYFGILCPSYKKGRGAKGFADIPGNTTFRAFANLSKVVDNTKRLGIKCSSMMLFADISIENTEDLGEEDWKDLERIITMDGIIAKAYGMPFLTLTEFEPKLGEIVGREGKIVDVSSIPARLKAIERTLWRDRQFYPEMFGWSTEKADERARIHIHSYYWQGYFIRKHFKYPVMVYGANDYEKAALYNGPEGDDWPVIIYPKKDARNLPDPTIADIK